mgnify:CR=1 FL=1
MITVDIKTFKGDLFKISCDEGSKLDQLLNKIKEFEKQIDWVRAVGGKTSY